MQKSLIIKCAILAILFSAVKLDAQNVGINTTAASPDSSAMLDISATDKGLLIPRMDSTSRKNILSPAKGLMVFDSTYNSFWFYNGIAWAQMEALDQQQLSMANDSLFLSNDATPVDLTGYRQQLNLSNDTLRISNGSTPIDLSPYKDNLGNHIATQNIQLNGHLINNDGDADEGIYVDTAGHVGFNHAAPTDALLQIGTAPGTVYKLKEDGFIINEYTLPITAGNANDIWMTDGNGNVSWVNPVTQGLGDTLGNHTATQNITSGRNWINHDATAFTGVCLDTFGQMGVNIFPAANLHVYMGQDTVSSQFAAFTSSTYTQEVAGTVWQSFTCTKTGELSDLLLTFMSWRNHNYTVTLLEGEGLGGKTLYATTSLVYVPGSPQDISFPPPAEEKIFLQAGQKYTIMTLSSTRWQLVDGNPYAGGQSSLDSNKDFCFKVLGTAANNGFMVSDTAVTFNEYSFPATDGTAGQSLVTDGAGNLSWIDLATGNNQQLNLVNDTLSLTNGGAPISLVPYLDADNLGNHSATQNLLLGTNRIQYNNSSADYGLRLGASNNLMVDANSPRVGFFKCNYQHVSGIGAYLEVRNKEGTRALFGPEGFGFTGGSTADVALANWSNGDLQFLTQGTQRMYISAAGNVGIGRKAVTNKLEVEGNASKSAAGNWLANSDRRLKKNIRALDSKDMLEKLVSLHGITYEWADHQTGTKRPDGLQYGFTAQNIQEVFPTLVTEDQKGYLQTAYGSFDAMTFEAIAALKNKVELLRTRNTKLKTQLEEVNEWKAELRSANTSAINNSKN